MTPFVFVLLCLAAWRSWVLLARDMLLDAPRDRWFPMGTRRRDFLECPYCSGYWHAGLWVGAYVCVVDWPGLVVALACWWAAAAVVVGIELVVARTE